MIEKKGFSISKIVIYLVLSLWAVTTVYPFLWVILNSFKDRTQIVANSFVLPLGELFTTKNYSRAFTRFNIWGAYGNSIIISGLVTVFVVIFAGLAAYGLARYHFKGRKALQSLVIASMMFPAFATIIPVFQMENSWGITNTSSVWLSRLSVILPQIAGNLSFAIVVLMGYIQLTIISDEVVSLQNQLEELQTENVTLTAQHEQMFDLATVKEVAEAAGMSKPSSSQIYYIDLSEGDSAVVYQQEESNLLSRLLTSLNHGIYAVVEYFE